MKRIILLGLFVILLSGCSTNYNIYFGESTISEDINLVLDGDINRFKGLEMDTIYIEDEIINYDNYVLKDKSLKYNKNINVQNNKSYVVLSSEYKYDDLVNSYNIYKCYDHIFVDNTDEYIYIYLKDFKCDLDTPINVSVSSYYKITNTNGAKDEDNTYTWKLENSKKNDNDIEITIEKAKNNINQSVVKSIPVYKIIIVILLLLTGIGIFIIHKKNSK